MNLKTVWCRTLFVPAGPHLSIGCLQTRAWEGEVSGHRGTARWLAQLGEYYRQETGMGHQEQQADRVRHGGLGRVTNAHTQQRYLDFLEN
jgi:peptidyl-tRNA hydrolase